MPTIAENIESLAQKASDIVTATGAIKNAITAKGGTVSSGDKLDDIPADIATIPSGGGGASVSKKDVNFYDYDGSVVASYTASEFSELSAMPNNPTHNGLTAQGWNWSLADAKTYVAKYDKLNIGQMYITSDGKTRLYISLSEGRISPILQLHLDENSELDIDWGDESTHSTFTSTSADYKSERHEYSTFGDYVIAITVVSGGFTLNASYGSSILSNGDNSSTSPDKAYSNAIKKVEIGDGVTYIPGESFSGCYSLTSITIPNSVTSIGNSGIGSAFKNCYSLSSITIPNGVTSIWSKTFAGCYSLTSITIPNSVTSISNEAFYECVSLESVTSPDSVTGIGSNAFKNCYSLSSITIPNGVTSIGESAFSGCRSLKSVVLPDSLTSIGKNAFTGCYSLTSIAIPNSVTSINDYTFSGCYSLSSITIPNGVTSIWSKTFAGCYSLSSITIPDSVTRIFGDSFTDCYSLATITINKASGSISGSPWGAITSSPTYTQIVWTG